MPVLNICYVFLCGAYFAFLQFSFFFALESQMSSAALTYLTTACSWIAGVVIGLSIPKKRSVFFENSLTLGAVAFFSVLSAIVHENPFDNSYLWLYALLTAGSGLYAGYFFTANSERFSKVKSLFFWENNGFMLGIFMSFLGMTLIGSGFIYCSLAGLCALILLFRFCLSKREEAARKVFDPILSQFITRR